MRRFLVVAAVLMLGACSNSPSRELVLEHGLRNETPARFGVCKGYGCETFVRISLSPEEWRSVRESFGSPPPDAGSERAAIARAIGRIEQLAGPKSGTADDAPGAAILNFDHKDQMDCIDEAFNSTTYLRFLARDGLLLWHDVGLPVRRGSFVDRWPHNTATVTERASGEAFAVDSWFHGNGNAAEVVPLALWLKGWSPKVVRPPCKAGDCAPAAVVTDR
ncbi:hypothetical protein [Govanella unica]|uniref:Lipoprotein n=1 Tax=Govanella unica TaxID=2975056 RepID=A0A9X3TZR0_9PROT|nr:hypothetical protein [Govania unica]MDA5194931.1 hypothetical protein [Govania unica]